MTKDFGNQVETKSSSGSSSNASLISSTSSTSTTTTTNSSSLFNVNINLNNDLGHLIADLRSACNEFYSLIRQIDTIAHKVEDKFNYIINNLEYDLKNSPISPSNSSSSSELISDMSENGNDFKKFANNGKNLLDIKSCINNSSKEDKMMRKTMDISLNKNSNQKDYLTTVVRDNKNSNRNSLNCKLISEIQKSTGINYNDSVLNKNAKSIRSKSANPTANLSIRRVNDETDISKLKQVSEIDSRQALNNGTMESSFYEDKLDNELEIFSCNKNLSVF